MRRGSRWEVLADLFAMYVGGGVGVFVGGYVGFFLWERLGDTRGSEMSTWNGEGLVQAVYWGMGVGILCGAIAVSKVMRRRHPVSGSALAVGAFLPAIWYSYLELPWAIVAVIVPAVVRVAFVRAMDDRDALAMVSR